MNCYYSEKKGNYYYASQISTSRFRVRPYLTIFLDFLSRDIEME